MLIVEFEKNLCGVREMVDEMITLRRGWTSRAAAKEIADLASLQVHVQQGDPFLVAPVRASVSCGRAELGLGHHTVRLSVCRVMIRAALENASIVSGSIRHIAVQEGQYNAASESGSADKTVRDRKVSGNVNLDPMAALGPDPKSLVKSQGGWSGSRTCSAEVTTHDKVERKDEIWLVCSGGHNAIAIGDDCHGNPLRRDGVLIGEFPRPDDDQHPLFVVTPDDHSRAMRITLVAAIPCRHLHLESLSDEKGRVCDEDRHDIEKKIRRGARATIKNYTDALRARMGRDEIHAGIRKRQGPIIDKLGLSADEIAITIESFEYVPSNAYDGCEDD
ncbi:MAG: hypothetical protein WCJ64_10545 [Rhodospirillaceae bacterium]